MLQVKVPEEMVAEIDKLVRIGLFRSRSEAVAEGVRRLLLAYSALSGEAMLVDAYISGRRVRGPVSAPEVDEEEAKRRIAEFFGTDDVKKVLERMRRRA